jgi:predicted PurR-regulated permease PerM
MVPATVVSVISGQSGSSFQPWTTSRGGTVEELALGTKTMEQMFQAAHDANTMLTWILRLVGFLCMAIGLAMVFSPLTAVADVIPFVGSIVGAGVALFAGLVSIAMSSLTIGLAWLFYRPLIGIPMLCITGICIFLVMKAGKARKAAAG